MALSRNAGAPRPGRTEATSAAEEITLTLAPEMAGMRFDGALARALPQYSRSRLRGWIDAGRVTLDTRIVEANRKIHGGEAVRVRPLADLRETPFTAEPIALDIVHEDATLVVVNKPARLVVHPGSGNWQGTLLNALLHRWPDLGAVPRAGIVHRLDKDTSGLMVVAKTIPAQTSLVRQLQSRSVKREYMAIASGDLARSGTIDAPIGRHPSRRTTMAISAKGKPARTHYRVLERFGGATLLHCTLETGRTHQIRVHLAAIGHPLVGDPAYGRKAPVAFPRQALHAFRLGLVHPATREERTWEVPLPADFEDLLAMLRSLDPRP